MVMVIALRKQSDSDDLTPIALLAGMDTFAIASAVTVVSALGLALVNSLI
jgi:hypothetical protein